MDILNLVILTSVIFKLFLFLRVLKYSKTEPLLPMTVPYLTTENFIFLFPLILLAEIKSLSEASLVAPYKFIGAAALSVLKAITLVID